MSKPSLVRTLSKKFGKKDDAGNDAEEKEKPELKRTLSSKFAKHSKDKEESAGSDREEKLKRTNSNKLFGKKDEATGEAATAGGGEKALKRTLSNKLFGKKDEKTGDDLPPSEESKDEKLLKRTLSNKFFGKKDPATGSDASDSDAAAAEKPKLTRTSSQRFKKEEKKKLKARFDVRVVRISKCQINNTTVFLGWKRPTGAAGGDSKRAVVTDCCATFGDTISLEAVLSLPAGEEKFKPALILFELKEDKLVRKGAGKAKWHVLGRGQLDLAEYARSSKALCIIPLQKKKANIQLELEITAVWQHYDGQKFEQLRPSPVASIAGAVSDATAASSPATRQKKVEVIGAAKYAVASDSEVDVYTEEDVDLNLSEIVSDEDDEEYKSAFAESSNPFEAQEEERLAPSSMAAMLSGLAGPAQKVEEKPNDDPPLPKREPPRPVVVVEEKKIVAEEKKDATPPAKQSEAKPPQESNPFGAKPQDSSNPFGEKVVVAAAPAPVASPAPAVSNPLTTCHDCKHVNKAGWKFCDNCGARSKVTEAAKAEEPKAAVQPAKPVAAAAAKPPAEPPKAQPVAAKQAAPAAAKPSEPPKQVAAVVRVEPQKTPAAAVAAVVSQSPCSNTTIEELRATIDQQRREIQTLKDSERRFSNTIAMAERKALAAESQLQAKEREIKRLSVMAGGSNAEPSELMAQLEELEKEWKAERRRREFSTMMENVVFLSTFSFTKDNESVAALKIFDELIRLGMFDETMAAENAPLMDHLFHTIMLLCQNAKVPQEITQHWVVTSVHLLRLLRDGKRRLKTAVSDSHPLVDFERQLCKLATNLYTRLFTFMLRKIESLLIRSLGTPYQSEAYFRPEELAMGEILREFTALLNGFKSNHWSTPMMELFFGFCVDLVNRFLTNKILQERKYCTLLNGIRIKMEVSFLAEWLMARPETERLTAQLDHVLEAANVLIMSKGRNATTEFRALNVRQIHTILAQYQPQQAPGAATGAGGAGGGFAVVPPGMSKSSQEIVERLERAKGGAPLKVEERGDSVDPLLLRRLEEDEGFARCDLLIPDRLAEDIDRLNVFLKE